MANDTTHSAPSDITHYQYPARPARGDDSGPCGRTPLKFFEVLGVGVLRALHLGRRPRRRLRRVHHPP